MHQVPVLRGSPAVAEPGQFGVGTELQPPHRIAAFRRERVEEGVAGCDALKRIPGTRPNCGIRPAMSASSRAALSCCRSRRRAPSAACCAASALRRSVTVIRSVTTMAMKVATASATVPAPVSQSVMPGVPVTAPEGCGVTCRIDVLLTAGEGGGVTWWITAQNGSGTGSWRRLNCMRRFMAAMTTIAVVAISNRIGLIQFLPRKGPDNGNHHTRPQEPGSPRSRTGQAGPARPEGCARGRDQAQRAAEGSGKGNRHDRPGQPDGRILLPEGDAGRRNGR